jgi:hypothetical protein
MTPCNVRALKGNETNKEPANRQYFNHLKTLFVLTRKLITNTRKRKKLLSRLYISLELLVSTF